MVSGLIVGFGLLGELKVWIRRGYNDGFGFKIWLEAGLRSAGGLGDRLEER